MLWIGTQALAVLSAASLVTGCCSSRTEEWTANDLISRNDVLVWDEGTSLPLGFSLGTSAPSGENTDLIGLDFIGETNVWVVGQSGRILTSANRGMDWTEKTLTKQHLTAVDFVDRSLGWVVGFKGTIFATVDGGNTWAQQAFDPGADDLWSVCFLDSQRGWAVGRNGLVAFTSNGGGNWLKRALDVGVTLGGRDEPSDLFSVFFANEQHGWIVGTSGLILATENGGNTWYRQGDRQSFNRVNFNSVHFANESQGWIVGSQGTILATENGGENWSSQASGTNRELLSVYAVSAREAWAVTDSMILGFREDEPEQPEQRARYSGVLATVDSGGSWVIQSPTEPAGFVAVHFWAGKEAFLLNHQGRILRGERKASQPLLIRFKSESNQRDLSWVVATGNSGNLSTDLHFRADSVVPWSPIERGLKPTSIETGNAHYNTSWKPSFGGYPLKGTEGVYYRVSLGSGEVFDVERFHRFSWRDCVSTSVAAYPLWSILAMASLVAVSLYLVVLNIYRLCRTRYIFISYSHKDEDFAKRLWHRLDREGFACWKYTEDSVPGYPILEQIMAVVKRYATSVVVLSENSVKSTWVKDEAELALKVEDRRNRYILCPLKISDCALPPDLWPDSLRKRLEEAYRLDFSSWTNSEEFDAVFEKLVDRRLKKAGHRRLAGRITHSYW